MDVGKSSGALLAYRIGQSIEAEPSPVTAKPQGPSFADMLEQAAEDTVDTIRAGEDAAIAGLKGEVSTQDVIEATMAMENAIQTSIAVRDKVVEAYQEILRMSV